MRILLTGPNFFGYNQSIANAFQSLNHSVKIIDYPKIIGSKKWQFYKQLYSISSNAWEETKLKIFQDEIRQYNKKISSKSSEYDILVVLKGDLVTKNTIIDFKENDSKTILWAYDKATRFPHVQRNADIYDRFYSFERSDVKTFNEKGIDCDYLPMGYDPDIYYPKSVETKYDIVFIGNLYDNRQRVLEAVINEFDHKEMKIWGRNYSIFNPESILNYYISKPRLRKRLINKNIQHNKINNIYNSSKICLNIHHQQSEQSFNPRTLEILGSGSFQIVDHKYDIDQEFKEGVEMYSDTNDLIELIYEYIDNPKERNRIAKQGRKRVEKNHKYKNRAERIIEDLYR